MKFILLSRVAGAIALPAVAMAQPPELSWFTIDCGGGLSTTTGVEIFSVIAQPVAAYSSAPGLECGGGFLGAAPPACYANCDGSSVAPVLTANDFQCFLNRFAAAARYRRPVGE